MALRVWLPLNGSLENKGVSGGTVALVGSPTVNNTGKIGKCYTLNGSNGFSINQQILPLQTPAWSFACWFLLANITSTAAACLFSERTGGNANGYTIFIYPNNSKMLVDDGVRWTVTPMTFSANTWYHLAVTRDSSGKKIYINGELKSSTTTIGNTSAVNTNGCLIGLAQSSSALATGNQGLIGDINDVRIYDHCLSAKEVKEISQGLVLHYKLDGFSGGAGENLLINSKKLDIASAISNKNCSNRGSSVRQLRTDGFNEVKCSAAWQGLSVWVNQFNLKSGDKLTYSFYVYTDGSNKSLSFYPMMYNSSGTRDTSSKLDISLDGGAYTSANSKSWGAINNTTPIKHYVTFIWNDTMASILNDGGKIELSIQMHGTFNSGEYGYIFAPKLEYGDKLTTWSPAPEEIGIDTAKIIDSSGYENNGIQNNIFFEPDSPRYLLSAKFNGSDSYIKVPENNWMHQGMEALTINLWAKATTWPTNGGRLFSCTQTGGFNLEGGSTGYWRFAVHVYTDEEKTSSAYKYSNTDIKIADLIPDDWNMITLVYDTTGTKTYLNGQLHHTYTNTSYGIHFNTNARLFLGCEANTANPGGSLFTGQESDFRIYTTVLSAEDILDLYHTPANIDNLGGIHGFEMVEDTSSRELLALPWTSAYSTHNKTSISTNYNDKHEWYSNTNSSTGSDYIKINPAGKTYYWDTEISVAAGNQFYIGFERYDENKTSRSNNACVYIVSIKPTSDIIHQRYFGTVNLATDGVNPTDTIALRILNAWSGTTSGSTKEGTIHYLSLREVSGKPQTEKIKQQGQVYTDEFVEREKQASIYENGFVGGNIIIEK